MMHKQSTNHISLKIGLTFFLCKVTHYAVQDTSVEFIAYIASYPGQARSYGFQ